MNSSTKVSASSEGVRDDLSAQEAVFRRDVALDVDEAQNAGRIVMGQEQPGQPTHGVADEVEALDPQLSQDSLCRLHQERDGDLRQVVARGLPAARCVVGEERAPGEGRVVGEVDVVLFRRAEAVEEDDGGALTGSADRGDREGHAIDAQAELVRAELGR